MDCRKVVQWGSTGKVLRQLSPVEYADPEDEIYYCKTMFKPLKLLTTWSKTISICYFMMADLRFLPAGKSQQWLDNSLKLAAKQMPAHDSRLTLNRHSSDILQAISNQGSWFESETVVHAVVLERHFLG